MILFAHRIVVVDLISISISIGSFDTDRVDLHLLHANMIGMTLPAVVIEIRYWFFLGGTNTVRSYPK
jgi:hypothetical protein